MFWRRDMRKQGEKPAIYVFFGLIAGGKSTLALAWAERLGIGCYNSDVVRKELAGPAGPGDQFGQGMYSQDVSTETYQALADHAATELEQGRSVVLDASYRRRGDRQAVCRLAEKYGVELRFILCSCPEAETKRRLAQRALDPTAVSDGRWEIYQEQQKIFEPPDELSAADLLTLPTTAPVAELVARLADELD